MSGALRPFKELASGTPAATADPSVSILIVDDNPTKRLALKAVLVRLGHNIVEADSGRAALRCVIAQDFAVILLDIRMPDMDGFETAALIRERSESEMTPIIFITANAGDEILNSERYSAGAVDFMFAPVQPEELRAKVSVFANLFIRAASLATRAREVEAFADQLLLLTDAAPVGIFQTDAQSRYVYTNPRWTEITGIPAEEAIGLEWDAIVGSEQRADIVSELTDAGGDRADECHRVEIRTPGSVSQIVLMTSKSIRDPDGAIHGWVGTVADVTAGDALVHLGLHDALTGLPNRSLLVDRLSQALNHLSREPSTLGVLFLDIDRFKVINDSRGHPAGDQVLLAMTKRLRALLRPGDTLARFGGDEFVILCEGLHNEREAVIVADRVHEAMTIPLQSSDGELVLSVSVGIASTTSALTLPEALLRDADAAMYCAKGGGRARAEVFAPSMRSTAIGRLDTEVELRKSITAGDFRVYYQPIVRLTDGHIIGAEALVRWEHPTKGFIGPDQFIPIAEETGLIVPLGEWVLAEACRQGKQFQSRDPSWSKLTMSVNLSGCQINQPGVVDMVRSAIADSGLHPDCLHLEITESVLMNDAAATVNILTMLKELGVRMSIDDFGTGYSSLAYLKRFPVDVLKIDRSFVNGLGTDQEDSAIVATIVSLAYALGLTVIAEGVETDVQQRCLIGLGCLSAQGYLFSRPVEASAIDVMLDRMAGQGAVVAKTVGCAAITVPSEAIGQRRSAALAAPGQIPSDASSASAVAILQRTQRSAVASLDTVDPEASRARLTATRSLLRAETVDEAVAVCIQFVGALGGWVVPARLDDGRALPLDCSFGCGEPLLPASDVGLARLRLEQILPEVLEDARAVIARIRRGNDREPHSELPALDR